MESYLPELLATLEPQKKLLAALEKRIELVNSDIESKSEYDQNEAVITTIKTHSEIDTLKKVLAEKTEYFEKYAKKFDIEYNDMQSKYDTLYRNAKLLMDKKPKVREVIQKIEANREFFEGNKQNKLEVYRALKALLQ